MSSKIILTQILKKAHANGYRCKSANRAYKNFSVLEFDNKTEQFSLKLASPVTTSIYHSSLSSLINDPAFLQAYFGGRLVDNNEVAFSNGNILSYLSSELNVTVEVITEAKALSIS